MAVSYYYVKNGGTATGDTGRETTARTGTFEADANNYDSIYDIYDGGVPTTAPDAESIICVAHTHAKYHTVTRTLGVSLGAVVSVDNANQENYLKGAIEGINTGTLDLTLVKGAIGQVGSFYGMKFVATDDVMVLNNLAVESIAFLYDCDLGITGTNSADFINVNIGDGSCVYMYGCDFSFGQSGQSIRVANGGKVLFDAMTLSGTAIATLFEVAGNGGNSITVNNSDLSSLTTQVTTLPSISNSDCCALELNRVLLGSAIPIFAGSWVQKGSTIKAFGLAFGTATDEYHYFEQEDWFAGLVTEETTIYRTAGSTYDGTNNFSAEMVGNSNVSFYNPLKFELAKFTLLPGASTNKLIYDGTTYTDTITFTIHLARDAANLLKDTEAFMSGSHSDGADKALGVAFTTKPAPLAAGTNLTNEAGGWTHDFTGSEGTDFEFMSISKTFTIGTAAGNIAEGAVKVEGNITINDTVFFCGKVDIS